MVRNTGKETPWKTSRNRHVIVRSEGFNVFRKNWDEMRVGTLERAMRHGHGGILRTEVAGVRWPVDDPVDIRFDNDGSVMLDELVQYPIAKALWLTSSFILE